MVGGWLDRLTGRSTGGLDHWVADESVAHPVVVWSADWFSWLIGQVRLVGGSVSQSIDRLVDWLVGGSVSQSIDQLLGWLVGWLVGRSIGRSVGWLAGWLVGRSVDRSVGWLVGRSAEPCVLSNTE